MNLCAAFIKNLIKSSLDQCVLPGTLTGTQILWLYMIQWRRQMADLTTESAFTCISDPDIATAERAGAETLDDQLKTEG